MAIVIQTPQTPIANKGFMYLNGMQLSMNATAPLTVLNVAPGQCRDYTNTNDIVINAVYNVNTAPPTLVSNFVTANLALSGAGGIDIGAVEVDTLYAVYAIGSSASPTYPINYAPLNQRPPEVLPFSKFPGTVILSKNFTAPILPAGYDMFRRIGTVVTSATSHIVPFTQVALNDQARKINYGIVNSVVTGGAEVVHTAANLNTVTQPFVPVKAIDVLLSVAFTPAVAGQTVSFRPTNATLGTSYASFSGSVAAVVTTAQVVCPCSVSGADLAEISYKVDGGTVTWGVKGFTDLL